MSEVKLEDIVSLCKRRGFVFPSSEIYGGLAGFYDYGPLGVELLNNIKAEWWRAMVRDQDNIYGLDSAIIQNPKLWEASGHVAGFTDPLVDCKNCGARHRADHLAGKDTNDLKELTKLLEGKTCPTCGKKTLMEPRVFNMMMKTVVGPVDDRPQITFKDNKLTIKDSNYIYEIEGNEVKATSNDEITASISYLRPETAGPMFTNYENVRETMRAKLPFGIAQIGKAFRNEISPRDFIFRTRELEQMEMQYFINPADHAKNYERWRKFAWDFLINCMGIAEGNISWHEHNANERAHYAKAAHDIYFKFPFGAKELWGTHYRTDFDLASHIKASGKDLSYFDEESGKRFVPHVVESSVGPGRMFLAVLANAYKTDEQGGENRIYLKLPTHLAPIKVAVFPLLKNKPELVKKAREVYVQLKKDHGNVMWDDNGNIGKRYRRQDEIGTPYCVTVDFDTLQDDTVTVRHRDTTEQTREKISELRSKLN